MTHGQDPRRAAAWLLAASVAFAPMTTAQEDTATEGVSVPDEPAAQQAAPAVDTTANTDEAPTAQDQPPAYRLEDADDALFDGDHAGALEIYLALADGSGWTAGEAALGAAKLYATSRGTTRDLTQAAHWFGVAFDRNFDAALEAKALGEAGVSSQDKLERVLVALANRHVKGDQVEPDFERAVDMYLRILDELNGAEAWSELCDVYTNATTEQARYAPGREYITSYLASLTLALMSDTFEGIERAAFFNSLGETRRGGADRAEDNLEEAKAQPFPVHYGEAVWAYERAADEYASGTAMYSLGIMHYRAMGFPEYWVDGADSPVVRFRKDRLRLETARAWFLQAILSGDPEGETWFVGVSQDLLDLIDAAPSDAVLDQDKQAILEGLRVETGLAPDAVSPQTWEGLVGVRERVG